MTSICTRHERNQLSTWNGCFIPNLLTILGAPLFLRLGFVVGMSGLSGAIGLLVLAELMSVITISSFSAIVSSGNTGTGGAYYMISRALGLHYGAGSGLLFWLSYSVNAAYNAIAFGEMIQHHYFPNSWWGQPGWPNVLVASMTLYPFVVVAYTGAGSFAKVNAVVLTGLLLAILLVEGSLIFRRETITLSHGQGNTFSAFSVATLKQNLWPDNVPNKLCGNDFCTVRTMFNTLFPAVVGMMEGLNLIGDLKHPEKSIPSGTLWATVVSFLIYLAMLILQAGTISRDALQNYHHVLGEVSIGGRATMMLGLSTACLSSILGSLFGAARILQSMARDQCLPGLTWFAYGSPQGDEPRNAVLLTTLIAQAFILIGSIDEVAPVLTVVFLLSYSLTDFSLFIRERFPRAGESFRPSFRFYSWQTSLANSILIIFLCAYLSRVGTMITGIIFVLGCAVSHMSHTGMLLERTRLLKGETKRKDGVLIAAPSV